MRRVVVLAATFAITATGVLAQRGEPDFSADRFKAHVQFLADDLLEGREAGKRGHEIAARYIASQFALLGLKPGGDDGTFLKKVEFVETARTVPTPTLVLTTPKGTRSLVHGKTAMIRGGFVEVAANLSAPLVFVGYGIKDATVGYDDYEGLDVRGKIVVVLFGSPKGMDSEIGAHLQSVAGRVAAERGAIGIFLVQTRVTAAVLPWKTVVSIFEEPTTTWVTTDGKPFDPNHGLKAGAFIEPTAASALFEGSGHSLTEILDEADKPGGRPKGFALKPRAEIAVTTKLRRFSSPEVVGIIEGSDPNLKNEYVALMGHADHIGVKRGTGPGDRINNGALDNAAGVATLLEVARGMSSGVNRPRRSILVVANTAEEKGLLGADYFAHNPSVPIDRITAAIDLDMPMILYDFTDVVAYGAGHSTLEKAFQEAGAAMGVKLSPDPMPEQAIFTRSDHYPMVKAGVPAVMLATGMANGGEAGWGKFLSTNYHQPSDDLSQPIVWKAAAKFAELNYRVVRALADADARPQWYENDYFGDLFAPKAPKTPKPGK
jgi:hypothetical protein